MAVKAETGTEVKAGLTAIVLALLFVLVAFLLHNVVWVVPGMIFGIGFLIWVLEKNGLGFFTKPKAGS
ncbi:hypothetical protein [Thermococcus sp. AM4]|uniref:hypothetical protein n=1 Tax=Thermococcus sp. (strain AM4) TaxID=246969 RepID=UPI0001870B7B|nr:hypothetical protein [Thermococcus sp. AM4]EEB73183.1 hypothetical protein TAM4_2040 [Thermococcus sp. AM4]